jgi:tetratricopeptide (TPR) repeat protein
MNKTSLLLGALFSIYIFTGCGGSYSRNSHNSGVDSTRQAALATITATESKLNAGQIPDQYNSNLAITAYLKFADKFADDSLTPGFLFKAASVAMSIGQYSRAVAFYDKIITTYPKFKKTADCVFIEGFIYDDKIKDTGKARAKYEEVIAKYPNDSIAIQAKAALSILGKSYDEIMKEFEKKNRKSI